MTRGVECARPTRVTRIVSNVFADFQGVQTDGTDSRRKEACLAPAFPFKTRTLATLLLNGEDDAAVETSAITITTATVGDQMNPWRSQLNQRVRNS